MKIKNNVVSIIVPVFNEQSTVGQVIKSLLNQRIPRWSKQIIVVNDGSTDESSEILKRYSKKIMILNHKTNLGKGAAIKSALKYVKGEVVIIQDADLEYYPTDMLNLINKYNLNNQVSVYGSRRLITKKRGYRLYVVGDWLANFVFRIFFREKLTDIFTGYKLVKTSFLKKMKLESRGFEIEMEITNWLIRNKHKIVEVAISYNPRTFAKGKKLGVLKGILLFFSVFKYRFLVNK